MLLWVKEALARDARRRAHISPTVPRTHLASIPRQQNVPPSSRGGRGAAAREKVKPHCLVFVSVLEIEPAGKGACRVHATNHMYKHVYLAHLLAHPVRHQWLPFANSLTNRLVIS